MRLFDAANNYLQFACRFGCVYSSATDCQKGMQHQEGEETAFKLSAKSAAKNKRSKRDESVFRRQAISVRGLSCQYIDIQLV